MLDHSVQHEEPPIEWGREEWRCSMVQSSRKLRVGMDARFLTHPQMGGFKTYTQNLIEGLAKIESPDEFFLYVDREPNNEAIVLPPHMRWRVVKGDWPLFGMPLREQVGLSRAVSRDQVDVFHSPALTAPLFLPCPLVLTLHDTIWHRPSEAKRDKSIGRLFIRSYYRYIPRRMAQKAVIILTVSYAAKADIVSELGILPNRIVVTYEAAPPIFRPQCNPALLDAIREKYSLPRNFVMGIGSADRRKNISGLIEAFSLLPREIQERHHLLIVFTHRHLTQELELKIRYARLSNYCHIIHTPTNQELVGLYNAAALFVYPSKFEGFGLPLLEAMACGTAVAASNNSSIPEVAGDSARFFDAQEPEQIAAVMQDLLNDDKERSLLAERGLRRAARFSWERCAQETVVAYHRAMEIHS